jgi:hypothetical protein
VVCQEDRYFTERVRYIHLNPLRAGIVATVTELNRYPYERRVYPAICLETTRHWSRARGRTGGRNLPPGPARRGGGRAPAPEGDRPEYPVLLGRPGVGPSAHDPGATPGPESAGGELRCPARRRPGPRESLSTGDVTFLLT